MYGNTFIPLTVDRVPARITLEVTDGNATEGDTYEPFHRLPYRPPLAPYEGNTIVGRPVHDNESTRLGTGGQCSFSITVESPDGDVLYDSGTLDMRMPITVESPDGDVLYDSGTLDMRMPRNG